ncbi:MAG: sigma-70 family RNA polymerase sigma factor [Planctomycetota bacterium]
MTSSDPSLDLADLSRHSAWMRRLARGLLGCGDAADDVVQDAWIRFGKERARPGYLAAVVRTLARRRQRADRRRAARERHAAIPEGLPAAGEVAARAELARRLAAAVDALDEPYRATVVLRYYDDLPSAEIARRAGIPAATVRARLKRGLDVLRARLDADGGGRERWVSALLPLAGLDLRPAAPLAAFTVLLTMKTTLLSLLAAGGLLLVWIATGTGDPAARPLAAVDVAPDADRLAAAAPDAGPPTTLRADAGAPSGAAPESASLDAEVARLGARVLDPQRRPAPGAWLTLRALPERRAAADAEGRVELRLAAAEYDRLRSLGGDRPFELAIGAPAHRTRVIAPYAPAEGRALELGDVVLEVGGAVHGRVVDANGLGVEGALVAFGVAVTPESSDEGTARRGPPDLHVDPWDSYGPAVVGTSGAGGEFRLDGVAIGFGTAWARTDTSLWAFSPPLAVRAGEIVHDVELVVREAPDRVISGRVVDPDGRPVPGVRLSFRRPDANSWNVAHTDARGAFWHAPATDEPLEIHAQSPRRDWRAARRSGVRPGTRGIEMVLAAVDLLAVEVVDAEGRPVGNGKVLAVRAEGSTRDAVLHCEAELAADGTAQLPLPEAPLRVRVEAWGYRHALVGPFAPDAVPSPLRVQVERVPGLVGRVLDPEGRPAANARVSLHRGAGSGGVTPPGAASGHGSDEYRLTHQGWGGDREPFVYELQAWPLAEVRADAAGRFRLPLPGVQASLDGDTEASSNPFAPGGTAVDPAAAKPDQTWYLHAALDGFATVTSGPHRFEGAPERDRDVELELRLPAGGAIDGVLELQRDVSPRGWIAYASDGLAEIATAPVGGDGAFRFDHLHPGGWQVRVFEPGKRGPRGGGRMRTERVVEPDVEVVAGRSVAYRHDARPRASARLLGRLLVDGRAPGVAHVDARTSTPQASIQSYRANLDVDGRFAVELQHGLETWVSIQLRGSSLWLTWQPQIVEGLNEWSFAFATAQLEGTLAEADARGRYGAEPVYVVERDGVSIRATLQVDEHGRFGPVTVPAGHGVLRAAPTDHRERPRVVTEVDLEPGETRTLLLRDG